MRTEPLFVAFARLATRWASRFRRLHKGSHGKAGGEPPEPSPDREESLQGTPAEQVPAPDVLAFCAAPA